MKRGQWILLIVFALIVAAVAGFFVATSATEQRLLAARAQLVERVETARAAAAERRQAAPEGQAEAVAPPLAEDELQALLDAVDELGRRGGEYEELAKAIGEAGELWPPDLLERIRAFMDKHADLIARTRALATGGATLPDPDLSTPDVRLDHVASLRAANGLLVNYARQLEAQGNRDEALWTLLDAMAVADLTGSQAFVLSQMARSGDYHRTLNALAGVMAPHVMTADQLNALERTLRSAYHREQFAAAIANEAQIGAGIFDGIRQSTAGSLFAPIININEASYIEGMGALAEVAAHRYDEVHGELEHVAEDAGNLPFTHYVSRQLLGMVQPALVRAIEDQARHEARVDLTRIAVALERHYFESGTYPDSLDAVASSFDGPLPRDPFTGQPYIYRRTDDTFLLYSVGSDGADDGGTHEGRDGDIVWGGR